MREIKFRAWDKERKLWLGYETLFPTNIENTQYEWAVSNNGRDWAPGVFQGRNIDRVQYTGLKDKNGKEIYEGDIIETFHYRRGIVEYHAVTQTGRAGWTARDPKVTEGPYNVDMMGCAVVGNIYENPELLPNQETK